MAIIAKAEMESKFEPISEGVHTAVCVGVIDLGLQYSEKYEKSSDKIMLQWELPNETYVTSDGEEKPRILSKEYTLSLGEKSNLRKDLQAWRGKAFTEEELKGFDLKNILGKACQIQIIHTERNGNTYANIASIMGLPKGMAVPKPVNGLIYIDLTEDNALNLIDVLPSWIQDKIKSSETYTVLKASENLSVTPEFTPVDDDLPEFLKEA